MSITTNTNMNINSLTKIDDGIEPSKEIDTSNNMLGNLVNGVDEHFTSMLMKQDELALAVDNFSDSAQKGKSSASQMVDLQLHLEDYTTDVQITSKVASSLVKSVDGLVHTQ